MPNFSSYHALLIQKIPWKSGKIVEISIHVLVGSWLTELVQRLFVSQNN